MAGVTSSGDGDGTGDRAGRSARARASHGMVATTDAYASDAGARVLAAGGNAVDAAVAAAFALAVVNPEAGNLGGGGFLVHRGADGTTAVLDFRSVAPGAATPDDGGRGVEGHRTVAVPGSVRGLAEAHRLLGASPWSSVVAPAVSLAEGFRVGARLLRSFTPPVVRALRRFPASAAVFLPGEDAGDGSPAPPQDGDVFRQPDLARTLRRIQAEGADDVYLGRTASLIVAEMERGGGLVSAVDLEAYRPIWRDPVRVPYRGVTLLSAPPPASGGLTLAQTAGIWRHVDPRSLTWHGPEHVHLLAETWRRVFADRNDVLADPEFADARLDELTSPGHAERWAGTIRPDRATPSNEVLGGRHTTHVSVVDAAGAAASLTTTINTWYGSKVVVGGAGFLLNSDMDDFTSVERVANDFGLVQASTNTAAPGKRMASTMCPTIVEDAADPSAGVVEARLLLVVGSPGGATIPTSVFQVISNRLDFGMTLDAAVDAPRVHHQHRPDELRVEPGALGPGVTRELRAMGHDVVEATEPWGDVQAIERLADGTLLGVSDGRRGGRPAGV